MGYSRAGSVLSFRTGIKFGCAHEPVRPRSREFRDFSGRPLGSKARYPAIIIAPQSAKMAKPVTLVVASIFEDVRTITLESIHCGRGDEAMVWVDHKDWGAAWEVVRHLPGGGQGACKLVRQRYGTKQAFLKVLKEQQNSERRERLYEEANCFFKYEDDNIPALVESNAHHYKDKSFNLYLVTDYIPGKPLGLAITENGCLSAISAISLTARLLKLVRYLHEHERVHRDIKPDNIILRNENPADPVLVDFGLSFGPDHGPDHPTEIGQELGNRFLRLPELSAHSKAKRDPRSDLAFAGAILLFALTGITPASLLDSDGLMPHQRPAVRIELESRLGTLFWPFMTFFDRAFQYQIADRFPSAKEMLVELEKLLVDPGSPATDLKAAQELLASRIDTEKNKNLAAIRNSSEGAMNEVRKVHQEVVETLKGVFLALNEEYQPSNTGITHTLGIVHSGDTNKRFAPKTEVRVYGDELTITVGGESVLRTDAKTPNFDEDFRDRVRSIFVNGALELTKD
jgi:serine/threonine-protein kinase